MMPRAAPRDVKTTSTSTVDERSPSDGGATAGLASTGRVAGGARRRVVKPAPKVTAPGESATGQRKRVAKRKMVTKKPISPTSSETYKGRQVDEMDRSMQTLVKVGFLTPAHGKGKGLCTERSSRRLADYPVIDSIWPRSAKEALRRSLVRWWNDMYARSAQMK